MSICTEATKSLPAGELGNINRLFHDGYQTRFDQHKSDIINGKILLIVRLDNRLVCMRGEHVEDFQINAQKYHQYKALCHIPLACFYAATLKHDLDAITRLQHHFNALREPALEDCEEAKQLLSASQTLLDGLNGGGNTPYMRLEQYASCLEPVLGRLIAKAADEEVAQLVKVLDDIAVAQEVVSAKTFMIVFGGHQPRYRELSKLTFQRWFAERDDHIVEVDHHVRFCEGGESLDDAIKLVATILTDCELSRLFLQSSTGLNQDVLGIAADKAIDKFWASRR